MRQCAMEFIYLLWDAGCVMMVLSVRVSVLVQVYLWGETQMSYPDTAHGTSAPTPSLAWETLQRENTHIHTHI